MGEIYPWIKALHIIFVIAWMAGLFYLPRLFVYHCQAETGSPQAETFKVMERRLLKAIMHPALIGSWVFGLYLVYFGEIWREPWMHAKFLLVLFLTAAHLSMMSWQRAFAEDRNAKSERFYRIVNEVPTVLMIFIVILVVIRPW